MSLPADSLARHWSLRLPHPWRTLALLSRLDRPVGWRLLVLPCWMGLALAVLERGFRLPDAQHAAAFLLGAVAARGAGCTFNDIVDRHIDAQVARTRLRPLPAGLISVRGAYAWLGVQIGLCLAVLFFIPWNAGLIALAAAPLVGAYPFMKRITWWPQAWLGLCFSWGALVGAAAGGAASVAAALLFLGCVAWVIAYDTVYALQDVEDDALVGVRSTARLFGARWRRWTSGFYLLAGLGWAGAAGSAGAPVWAVAALAAVGAAGALTVLAMPAAPEPAAALRAFRANVGLGAVVVAALLLTRLATAGAISPGG